MRSRGARRAGGASPGAEVCPKHGVSARERGLAGGHQLRLLPPARPADAQNKTRAGSPALRREEAAGTPGQRSGFRGADPRRGVVWGGAGGTGARGAMGGCTGGGPRAPQRAGSPVAWRSPPPTAPGPAAPVGAFPPQALRGPQVPTPRPPHRSPEQCFCKRRISRCRPWSSSICSFFRKAMCRCTLWIWCSRDTVSIATKFTVQACGERRRLVIRHAAAHVPGVPATGRARWARGADAASSRSGAASGAGLLPAVPRWELHQR